MDEKAPYRIHPNKLACKGNVYDRLKIRFDVTDMIATVKNIGIQSITKTHIVESLKVIHFKNIFSYFSSIMTDDFDDSSYVHV